MNKIHKLIWSKALGCVVVVSECAKGTGGKKSGRRKLASVVAASSLLTAPAWANDLPTGGQVVSGAASIATSGNAMTINQSTDKMIANWQSFSIGTNNSVTFNQPGAASVALNRVVGQDASQILGSLNANGQVFLINPNGVAIGTTGSVQTGGFVASTLGITNEDFLAGHYQFNGIGGTITNQGAIVNNGAGNVVALIAPSVTNEGTITGGSLSDSGIALAAGTDVLLDFDGDGLLSVEVKSNTLAGLVENKGLIQADGGVAILTSKGASDALKGVVNNSGTIQANTLASRNGRILLIGDMSNGEVNAAGSLKADFVETSAATVNIDKDLKVETNGGEWLIDPVNITIDTTKASAIQTALNGGSNVTVTTANGASWAGETNGTNADEGNITVNAPITWGTNGLTLRADNNITINAELTATNTAELMLQYAQSTSTGDYFINAPVNLSSFSLFRTQHAGDAAVVYAIIDGLGAEGSVAAFDLQGMNGNLSRNYVLGANIDASSTSGWNSGAGFDPIGNSSTKFTGTFDGLGHTITGLTINRSATDYVGLFGYTSGATIQNIGLIGGSVTGAIFTGGLVGRSEFGSIISNAYVIGSVTGYSRVGGLVGLNDKSSITNSYATATVIGNEDYIGGLVGMNQIFSTITNSYATGNVVGGVVGSVGGLVGGNEGLSTIENAYATGNVTSTMGSDVGGLVGRNNTSTIKNAYATGSVTGVSNVGGLVGDNTGTITNGYYVEETTGQSDTGKGTKLATIADLTAALPNGFESTVWGRLDDSSPYLLGNLPTSIYLGGDTTRYNVIYTLDELQAMNNSLSSQYALWQDIDASSTSTWNGGLGFDPIGDLSTKFTGKFDGLGHTITGLTINRSTMDYVGLFGSTSGATISNVGMVGGSVSGGGFVGGLAGVNNFSTISNAYATGSVSGGAFVGGLVGGNNASSITNAYATGSVTSSGSLVGGLVGYNDTSTISNTYATGSVSGSGDNIGGLLGYNDDSTITNAYATGSVTGGYYVGGLLGYNDSSTITNVYATGGVTGDDRIGGLVGYNDSSTITNAYATGGVTGSNYVGGLVGGNFNPPGTSSATISNSFYDTDTTGQAKACGFNSGTCSAIGLTTAQMKDPFTFIDAGWDFASIWGKSSLSTPENSGYMMLRGVGANTLYDNYVGVTGDTSKTYGDANPATPGFTANSLGEENVTLGWGSAITATTNAGEHSYSSPNVLDVSTNAGSTYTDYGIGALTVTQRVLSLSGARSYDGTSDLVGSVFTLGNLANGDTLSLTGVASMADKNVGSGKSLTLGTLALADGSGLGSNYTLVGGAYSADISKASISAITGITAENKTYDGTSDATLDTTSAGFTGMVSGETLTVTSASGSFADKNAGAGKTVNIIGLSLGGTDAANYTLSDTTAVTMADITQAVISAITGITAENKAYDGTTDAALNTSSAGFTGMLSSDVLTVASASGSFADKNAGDGKSVSITGLSLGGADAGNYTLADTTATTTADIAKAALTLLGLTVDDKTYDGTTVATIGTLGTLSGLISGDSVTTDTALASAAFSDKNAGKSKTVTLNGIALSGSDAGNYTIDGTATTTADIAQAVISAITAIAAADKIYDGTTDVTLDTAGAGFTGMVTGDALSVATATGSFTDKNAGADKTVSITGLSLGGADAGNYTLADTVAVTAADIAQAAISAITGITAADKTYDGTTTAMLDTSGAAFAGMIAGDTLTVASSSGAFSDENAGAGKTVNISGLTLGGRDAGNYTLADTVVVTTADIAKAVISAIADITAADKIYDGTTTAMLDTSGAAFAGMVAGDTLTVATSSGVFSDENVGAGKTVNISGLTLGGTDAGNYTLADTTATTTADIFVINIPPLLPPTQADNLADELLTLSSSEAFNTAPDLIQVDSMQVNAEETRLSPSCQPGVSSDAQCDGAAGDK